MKIQFAKMTRIITMLTLLAALAGCVPVSAPASTPGASVVTAPTAAAAETIELAMGYIPSVQFAPFYVAVEKGFYREEGLEVKFRYGFESDLIKLVGSNELQFMIGSGEEVIYEEDYWLGHVNTSPKMPHILTFCHEGPWTLVENRIWGLDMTTGKTWQIRPNAPDEAIGHEYWTEDGEHIGYHGRTPNGAVYGSIRYDNTDQVEAPFPHGSMHFHSVGLRLIVGDGGKDNPYLLLMARREQRARSLLLRLTLWLLLLTAVTLGGLARRSLETFWPLVAERAGFAQPGLDPLFLTVETAQYFMARLVLDAQRTGVFDSISISPFDIMRQTLDNLSKAAVSQIPLDDVADRLIAAWGERHSSRPPVYRACLELARQFREQVHPAPAAAVVAGQVLVALLATRSR